MKLVLKYKELKKKKIIFFQQFQKEIGHLCLLLNDATQGSVLGPLQFHKYINELPLASNNFIMLMYADDTTLYCNVNINVTNDLLNCELSKIYDLLGANKLALNVSKTKYMVFHTANKHVTYPKLNINTNNIELVTNFNLLAMTLSSILSWN